MVKPPAVIDADELQRNPKATLRSLCDDLEIPLQASMLKWEAGPIPEEGLWAPWWYKTLQKSTGFSSPNKYPNVQGLVLLQLKTLELRDHSKLYNLDMELTRSRRISCSGCVL